MQRRFKGQGRGKPYPSRKQSHKYFKSMAGPRNCRKESLGPQVEPVADGLE
jgi:hypothetical protein